jgi:hypothetical protein
VSRAIVACVLVLTALGGCAAAPEKIAPAKIAVEPYLQMNCEQLKAERVKVDTTLTQEERDQRSVRNNDTWGVALLGLPVGRMSGGNREDKIAELKGDEIAIDDASKSEHCSQ